MDDVSVMVTGRDRALLRAIESGRCEFRGGYGSVLLVDGLPCADASAAWRLVGAGLVSGPDGGAEPVPVTLTEAGRAALRG